jgi:hypothetical protein
MSTTLWLLLTAIVLALLWRPALVSQLTVCSNAGSLSPRHVVIRCSARLDGTMQSCKYRVNRSPFQTCSVVPSRLPRSTGSSSSLVTGRCTVPGPWVPQSCERARRRAHLILNTIDPTHSRAAVWITITACRRMIADAHAARAFYGTKQASHGRDFSYLGCVFRRLLCQSIGYSNGAEWTRMHGVYAQ